MDKQIIKNIIIEKQIAIPNYKLVHRDFLFGDKSNYILVGIRRAGKSDLLYQDIQTRLNKGEQSAQDILYINFEDERLSSLKVGCSKFESKIRYKKWCYFGAAKLLIFNTLIYEIVL